MPDVTLLTAEIDRALEARVSVRMGQDVQQSANDLARGLANHGGLTQQRSTVSARQFSNVELMSGNWGRVAEKRLASDASAC